MLRSLWPAVALLVLLASATAHGSIDRKTVDLNSASIQELMQLPGVGRKRAEEVIRRRLIRPYRRTSELLRIRGIGRRTYLKLRPFVRVDPPAAEATPASRSRADADAPGASSSPPSGPPSRRAGEGLSATTSTASGS